MMKKIIRRFEVVPLSVVLEKARSIADSLAAESAKKEERAPRVPSEKRSAQVRGSRSRKRRREN